ncbi:g protein-coupled receptor-related [Anaeramoeba flamelloides]|uniref:G protein-coupled receptor-related n=1 Tax=Anaeramoeba flamelloides TaxID=1746091 RepID=A0ABQ8YGU7_9EUKA|nr:g protein-coupled receptor-related [Anaeramoeba flamelloides]
MKLSCFVLIFIFLSLCVCERHDIFPGQSLKEAITNAEDGDSFQLFPGLHRVEQLDLNALIPVGGTITIYGSQTAEGDKAVIVFVDASNVIIQDATDPLFLLQDTQNLIIQNVKIKGCPYLFSFGGSNNASLTFQDVSFVKSKMTSKHYIHIVTEQVGMIEFNNCNFNEIEIETAEYSVIKIESPNVNFTNIEFGTIYLAADTYTVDFNFDYDEDTNPVVIESSQFGRTRFQKGSLKVINELEITQNSKWISGTFLGSFDTESEVYSTMKFGGELLFEDADAGKNYYDSVLRKIEELNVVVESGFSVKWEGYETLLLGDYGTFTVSSESELILNGQETTGAQHAVPVLYGVSTSEFVISSGAIVKLFPERTINESSGAEWGFLVNGPFKVEDGGSFYLENGYFTIGEAVNATDHEGNTHLCRGEYQNYGSFYIAEAGQGIGKKTDLGSEEGRFVNYGDFQSLVDVDGTGQSYDIDVKFVNSDDQASLIISYDTNTTFTDFSQDNLEDDSGEHSYLQNPYLLIKEGANFISPNPSTFNQGTIRGDGTFTGEMRNTGATLWPGIDRYSELLYDFKTFKLEGNYIQTDQGKYRIYIYNKDQYEKLQLIRSGASGTQTVTLEGLLDIVFLWPYVMNLHDNLTIIDLENVKPPWNIELNLNISNIPPTPDYREDPSTLELSQRFWKTIVESGTPGESDYDPYLVEDDAGNPDYYRKEFEITDTMKENYQDYFHEFTYFNETDKNSLYGILIKARGCPPGKQYLGSREECVDCSRGTYSEEYASTGCTLCQPGNHSADQGAHRCVPCATGKFSDEGSGECSFCPVNKYNDKEGQSECIDCPSNTRASEKGAQSLEECLCNTEYYHDDGKCLECPAGGVCDSLGTNTPAADEGFWNRTSTEAFFYSCIPKESCLGNGECGENYEGRMCGICKPDTYRLGNFCVSCGKEKIGWRIFAFLVIFCLVAWACYMFASIGYPPAVYFATVTILVSFVQEISFLSLFELSWPKSLIGLFDFLSILILNIDLFGAECYNSKWSFPSKFIFALFIPLLFAVLYYLYYLCASVWSYYMESRIERIKERHAKWFDRDQEYNGKMKFFKKRYHRSMGKLHNFRTMDELYLLSKNSYNAYTFILSFCYVIVCYWVLKPMDCTNYETGFSVFDPEPQYACEGSRYGALLAFSIIFVLVYVVGIPLWMYYQFQKNKDRVTFREEYGLLIGRFKDEWYFWEIVLMGRRLMFVMFALFLSRYPMMQTAFAEMALFLMLLLQLYARPFKEERHNRLEFSLLASRVVISLGGTLFYGGDIESNTIKNLLTAAVFIMVLLSLIALGIMIWYDHVANIRLLEEKAAERKELEKHLLNSGAILPSSINEQKIGGQKVWKTLEILHFLKDETVPTSLLGWLLQAEKEQRERFADIAGAVIEYALEQSAKLGIVQLNQNELNKNELKEKDSDKSSKSGSGSGSTTSSGEDEEKKEKTKEDDELAILEDDNIDHVENCISCWEDEILPFVADAILFWLDEASVLEKRSLSVIFRSLDIYMKEHADESGSRIMRKFRSMKRKIGRLVSRNKNQDDDDDDDDDDDVSDSSTGSSSEGSTTGSTTTATTSSTTTGTSSSGGDLELQNIQKDEDEDEKDDDVDLDEIKEKDSD